MNDIAIDHLVIAASTLEEGVLFAQKVLGVAPQPGGKHERMGTHNCLLKLGDSAYLEVIAANPNAPKPARPRWFELDQLERNSPPRLAAWIARTADIRATAKACSEPLGNVEPMSRGELNWQITITNDGRLVLAGIAPMLIEWRTQVHPATQMRESGCKLLRLEGFHPDTERISTMLGSLGFEGEVHLRTISAGARPHLVAHVQTADGVRILRDG